jgi:hypothetical protein
VVLGPAKTGVLPVWACGLGRTLLAVEVRNAYWRQFHAMRVQAFNHATVFPRDSTAKPLHIRTAISSQGDLCLRIRRRWGRSGSRSPRYRGGSSNRWRRSRRWGDLRKDFPVCGFQSGNLAHHLVLTGGAWTLSKATWSASLAASGGSVLPWSLSATLTAAP